MQGSALRAVYQITRAASKTSMIKSVQTVILHSFAKAKTQVAKGSRKPRERTPEEQRRESFRESRICCACCVVYVGDHIFMQAAAAGQPAASRSRPASSSSSGSSSTEGQVFQGKIEKPRRISAKAARKPRERTAKVENIRERYLAPAKSFSKFSSSSDDNNNS